MASIAALEKGIGFHPFCAHTCSAKCSTSGNVFPPLSQRRQHQRENIDAVKQILSKLTVFDECGQIPMRGHQHAHIDAHRLFAAYALDFAFFKHAQEFGLHVQRHVANLVKKKRPVLCLLEFAHVPSRRAGERAFLMPEQFGFD